MMTQREQVLSMLTGGWVCGTQFLAWRIPRYGARILELRKLGHKIERRPCEDQAHDSQQYQWRIIP